MPDRVGTDAWLFRGSLMSYVAVSFEVNGRQAEAFGDALLEAGALSVDAEDARSGTPDEAPLFAEPGAEARVEDAWPAQRLTALFVEGVDIDDILGLAAKHAGLAVSPASNVATVPEQDWVRLTQAQFGPIRVDARLWIVPSWSRPVDPEAINLVLDPGLAFGTGSHPTTRLCLRWLVSTVQPGQALLDYGCGSGILAIAARRLGASRVVGIDIDPDAVRTSRENARRNSADVDFAVPADDPGGSFDRVVANILANPLRVLAPALAARTRIGGLLLLAGVLEAQADEVAAAYAPWFTIGRSASEDRWVALAGERLR